MSSEELVFSLGQHIPKMTPEEKKEDIYAGSETLLIADDEERIREITKKALTARGYKVLTAVDGKEAVKIFKAQN
jgi:ActR/RegA family two-component response regulator